MATSTEAPCRPATSLTGIVDVVLLGSSADHEDRAWPVTGADEDVSCAGGAVEEVPLLERALLLLDDQGALAAQHQKGLLGALLVVVAVRLARLDDVDVGAELGPAMVVALERDVGARLLVGVGRGVAEVEDEPALRRDDPSVLGLLDGGLGNGCLSHVRIISSDLVAPHLHRVVRERLEVEAQKRLGV